MQGCFAIEVTEAKTILEWLKLSKLRFDPLLVESNALNVVNLCVSKLLSRCEVDNVFDKSSQRKQEYMEKRLTAKHC
ncbi:hypothetical protein ACOSP7_010372 [Xanthoceras sorbifolium]